ncbi:MAG: haloacid dehalogenase-like hydrolase [Deltaproteobacteria bacterium]|nr:haloacid dehalogenase-like hydrolase [Deltaproteobacteria bacterium]
MLPVRGWHPALHAALAALIEKHAGAGAAAVFDFDDTLILGDLGDQTFRTQLDELTFGLTPEEFAAHLPVEPNGVTHLAPEFGGARIADVSADLAAAYAAKEKSAAELRAKLALFFHALPATEGLGKAFAYPWTNQLYAGLAREELRALARKAWDRAVDEPLGSFEVESPADVASKAGVQRARLSTGLRAIPELTDLLRALRAADFSVFILTASMEDIVAEIAADPNGPFALPRENILGMRLVTEGGRYTRTLDTRDGYAVTFGTGKTQVIRNVIGRAPVLVFGDSDTDLDMLTAFAETEVRVLIDRGQTKGPVAAFRERCAGNRDGHYLQGRNQRDGTLNPSVVSDGPDE